MGPVRLLPYHTAIVQVPIHTQILRSSCQPDDFHRLFELFIARIVRLSTCVVAICLLFVFFLTYGYSRQSGNLFFSARITRQKILMDAYAAVANLIRAPTNESRLVNFVLSGNAIGRLLQ